MLEKYNKKRNFLETPEPEGKHAEKEGKLRFVIQKHEATRLHYDLRLELDGVMLSWAVPKGPSLDPSVKHLAMKVEDHPISYMTFEGVIPEGNYGAGTVMVWDIGTYTSPFSEKEGDDEKHIKEGLEKGDLKFELNGKKLKGSFVLVRIKDRFGKGDTWLLIKHRDDFISEEDITKQDKSALSGRSMEEITKAG